MRNRVLARILAERWYGMAPKKRGAVPARNRKKKEIPALLTDRELRRRIELSEYAILLIKSMNDNLPVAIACVEKELKGALVVDWDPTPKKNRIHIYLKGPGKDRRDQRHCHIIIASNHGNSVVSARAYGRRFV